MRCFRCGGTDTFSHLLECSGVGPLPVLKKPQILETYLLSLINLAAKNAPVWPVPIHQDFAEEISLADLSAADASRHSVASSMTSDRLSFDMDSEMEACEPQVI